MTLNNHTFVSTGFYRWGNCREWEKPCGCCLRITPWETPWELLTSHTPCESERHLESCLHCTLKARETLRAAYTHQTPWEWETPWELLTSHTPCESERNPESCLYTSNTLRVRETLRAAYITPCESERHFESCLHHTLWEWETPWELLTSQLVRVWEKPCDSCPVRHSVRVLPGGISCELWCSDTLWEIPCEIYTLRQFLRRIEDLFRVFHCGQGRFDRTENVKTAHETTLVFGNCTPFFRLAQCVKFVSITMHAAHWHRGQNSKQTLWNNISMDMFFLFVFSCQDLHFCCTQLGK